MMQFPCWAVSYSLQCTKHEIMFIIILWTQNIIFQFWKKLFLFSFFFTFFHPPTTANDLRLRRISNPDFIHYIFCPIFILQNEPVFPFFMLSAKQGNYLYHYYNVFGMTRALTGDWTRDLPHSKPALYH